MDDKAFGSTRSFVLKAGGEVSLARRINVRLEFQHLDGSRNQIMFGVPVHF